MAKPPPVDDREELRQLTREAHEAIADLRAVLREAAAQQEAARERWVQEIDTRLQRELRRLGGATSKAVEAATEKVYARFDHITAVLLGEDPQSVREGNATIPELVEKKAALRRQWAAARPTVDPPPAALRGAPRVDR